MAKGKGKGAGDVYKPPKWKRGGRSVHKQKTFSPYPLEYTNTLPLRSPFPLGDLPPWARTDGSSGEVDVASTDAGDNRPTLHDSEHNDSPDSDIGGLNQSTESGLCRRVISDPVQPTKPKLRAMFTGTAVHVVDVKDATILYRQGCFGKGDQSRGHASWMPEIDTKRFNNRNSKTRTPGGSGRATPVLPTVTDGDVDSDAELDITSVIADSLQPEQREAQRLPPSDTLYTYTASTQDAQRGCTDPESKISPSKGAESGQNQPAIDKTNADEVASNSVRFIVEREVLGFEETFYLVYALQCLDLYREGEERPMTIQEVWTAFCTIHAAFVPRYTVYHHYRSCGWVPRSGLKYATDFVLYKMGPIFTHSSYNVLIRTENTPKGFGEGLSWMSREEGWGKIQNLQRMTEGVAKDTVLAWVIFPESFDYTTPDFLGQLRVDEYIIRRWRPEGT